MEEIKLATKSLQQRELQNFNQKLFECLLKFYPSTMLSMWRNIECLNCVCVLYVVCVNCKPLFQSLREILVDFFNKIKTNLKYSAKQMHRKTLCLLWM